jgi:hypothetical protein
MWLLAALLTSTCANAQAIILTSDQQLTDLANDPNKKIDNSTGYTKSMESLSDVVNQAKRGGSKQIAVAFDEFFRQYRTDTNVERNLTPDMDEYVEKMGKISDYVAKEGIGLELSLLSPLELGQAYKNQCGKNGRWVAYKVGLRNPNTGQFSVQIWQQLKWTNNKGETPVKLHAVKAFAFKQQGISRTMMAVNPGDIKELKNIKWEVLDTMGIVAGGIEGVIPQRHLRVYGDGDELKGYDHVFVLLEYDTQEMDYFADDALPFLKNLLKKYHDRGINLTALYSDEMHIQQDWIYFGHQEEGQFAERYLTDNMAKKYTEQFGQEFDERYLLYFVSQPQVFMPTTSGVLTAQYVMGTSPVDVQRTFLLRDRYFRMLNNGVIELFKTAKAYGEQLFGRELRTSAHSSWAESPTIDKWNTKSAFAYNYEYTPDFMWSNTVHQASAACYDYFKWGEYLQPTGNDFCECGWLDRDYYGAAMAASISVINKFPNGYAAAWGMPNSCYVRRMAINNAFGCAPPSDYRLLTDNVIRDVDVLMLYPMSLVAVDQRFGSWMTQYAYGNYLTSDMLLKMGTVTSDGHMKVAAKQYGTIAVMFEPLPDPGLIEMLQKFVNAGGKVVWFSAPPMLDKGGNDCTAQWQNLFGAKYSHPNDVGEPAPGRIVNFTGTLSGVEPQTILTDFVVDYLYPVTKVGNAEVIATNMDNTIGTAKKYPNGGAAYYLGFRPRDDQSKSLGYETRTLFEILDKIGAYPATGKFKTNDNPSYLSRNTDYFMTTFPNKTTFVVRHYRTHVENWDGGFSRDDARDAEALKNNPLPTDTITLANAKINGHDVTYNGKLTLAFNGDGKQLTEFMGHDCTGITFDGKKYTFATGKLNSLTFGPVNGDKNHYNMYVNGQTSVTIPVTATAKTATVTCAGSPLKATLKNGSLTVNLEPRFYNNCVDIVLK